MNSLNFVRDLVHVDAIVVGNLLVVAIAALDVTSDANVSFDSNKTFASIITA